MPKKLTQEIFVERSENKHNFYYDYSKSVYVDSKAKVEIICPIHGSFWQSANGHMSGQGCPEGGGTKKNNTGNFIRRAEDVHDYLYDYSKSVYVNNRIKIEIICHVHGSFWQIPNNHLRGSICKKCSDTYKSKQKRMSLQKFIKRSNEIHNNKYDYSLVEYINVYTKVKIICPIHGIFEQKPNNHLKGCNCLKCGYEINGKNLKKTSRQFIIDAIEVHGDKYNYSSVDYKESQIKVKIICPVHGIFEQKPNTHLNGAGCPKCPHNVSKGEKEISNWLESLNLNVETSNRTIIKPKEIDIYLPDFNLGIEHNGIYWHSDQCQKDPNYHQNKTLKAREAGVHLMQVWDTEWNEKQDIVKSIILREIGKTEYNYYTKNLMIKEVKPSESKVFCKTNYINGFRDGRFHNGLYFGNKLIALMIVGDDGEMIRFVVKNYCSVSGGFSKLLKYSDIKYSFVDQRVFNGSVYYKNGFKLLHITKPNYFYTSRHNKLYDSGYMKFKKRNINDKSNKII